VIGCVSLHAVAKWKTFLEGRLQKNMADQDKYSPRGGLGSRIKAIWRQKEMRHWRLKELKRMWLGSEGIRDLKTKHR